MRSRAPTNNSPLAAETMPEAASTSVAVCELVSDLSDTPIQDLPPLGRRIDPDALDALFPDGTAGGKIAFRYAGYVVLVRSNGAIKVYREVTVTD